MKPISLIRDAIQAAKSSLQDRVARKQAEAEAEAAKTAEELRILEEHANIMVTREHLAGSYAGAASNLEALLKTSPLKTTVSNMRGFCFPGFEAFESLAAYHIILEHKAEIMAELRSQTIAMSDAQIADFESKNRAVLQRHGLL